MGRAARGGAVAALNRIAGIAVLTALLAAPAAAAAPGPLAPATALQPSPALFADRITAVATVVVDSRAVDPATVRAVGAFGPLDVLSGPEVERSDRGRQTVVRFRWQVACLSEQCVPSARRRPLRLPPLRVSAKGGRDGHALDSVAAWPVLTIAGRVSAREAAAAVPPFRLETELPRPTYRVAPARLGVVLDAVAAAGVAGLFLLLGRELRSRRRRREEERLALVSPLERALLLARQAERRGPADRRKALNLLARVLGGPGAGLAGAASELAWAPPEPSPAQIGSVVDEVEREVGER